MSKEITLGLIQMSMNSSADENRQKADRMISEAAKKGAEIICLPELFTSPYFCVNETPSFEYAEKFLGETTKFLQMIAQREKIFLVGGSIHEEESGKYYNTSAVIDNKGELMGNYRKTHIPHDPCFYEQNYFAPGDTGFKVFQTTKAKISVLICYDQWFPEAARACALLGADIIFYPTAISTVDGVAEEEGNWQEAWENVQRGHAIANNVIVAGVNRVGKEGNSNFWGGSFVCDAFGKTLVRGGREDEVIVQKVDLEHSKKVREGWRFFYNRRPNTYQDLMK